ncbi:MAG: lipoprotein signal peptidase, partial [Bacteroidales bacterium]
MQMSIRSKSILVILLILIVDQILKIYIKTNFAIGDEVRVLGNWFVLHFTENPGMAFGMKFWGIWGKILLGLFRLAAIIAIAWYIHKLILRNTKTGIVIGVSLILAGAIGNLIDSAFYGFLFDSGTTYNNQINQWMSYPGISNLNFAGYAGFLKGCVVDMLYFPVVDTVLPSWVPVWGGEHFVFFR